LIGATSGGYERVEPLPEFGGSLLAGFLSSLRLFALSHRNLLNIDIRLRRTSGYWHAYYSTTSRSS